MTQQHQVCKTPYLQTGYVTVQQPITVTNMAVIQKYDVIFNKVICTEYVINRFFTKIKYLLTTVTCTQDQKSMHQESKLSAFCLELLVSFLSALMVLICRDYLLSITQRHLRCHPQCYNCKSVQQDRTILQVNGICAICQ